MTTTLFHEVAPPPGNLSKESAAVYVRRNQGLDWQAYGTARRRHPALGGGAPTAPPAGPTAADPSARTAPAVLPLLQMRPGCVARGFATTAAPGPPQEAAAEAPPAWLPGGGQGLHDELLLSLAAIEDEDEKLEAVRVAAARSAQKAEIAHAAAMVNPLWARRDVELALRRQELERKFEQQRVNAAQLMAQPPAEAFTKLAPVAKGGTNPVRRRKLKDRPISKAAAGELQPRPPPAMQLPPGGAGARPTFRLKAFMRPTPLLDAEALKTYHSKDRPQPDGTTFVDLNHVSRQQPAMFPPLSPRSPR